MNTGDTHSNGDIQLHSSLQSTLLTLGFPISSGSGGESHHSDRQSMYKAAFKGNWERAEELLRRCPSLADQEITETRDQALHVAISMGHKEFALNLIEWMTSSGDQLGLRDGHGYTACCYAAMTGMEEVARKITEQNQNLGTARNGHGMTPLQLAASYGNREVVLQFLKFPGVQYLSPEEWFDLLLVTIRSKMYDVALNVFERDKGLAIKTDVDGTALHVLAQLDNRSEWKAGGGKLQNNLPLWAKTLWNKEDRNMQSGPRLELAEKLWAEIQKLERDHVLKLMKNPPILHDAAKVGNVELITMITHAYPELLWHINSERCTVFHIAVMYRQEGILDLIKQTNIKDLNALSECVNGNNIVHLAGKLPHPDALKIVSEPDLQMKSELAWFKRVEAIVPPLFLEKRNTNGHKPRELFWMEHKNLLEESMKHLKSTSESCLLVATIILTVVFAAAFAPPGGYDETGVPILLTNSWFTSFVIFEVLALFSSTYSILTFWSILSSNYEEDQFLSSPNHMRHALSALLFSVLCAISAFLSGFFLVFVQRRKALVVSFMLPVYVWLVVGVSFQFFKLFPKTNLLEYYSRMGASPSKYNCFNDSLWRRGYNFGFRIVSSVWKFICDQFSKRNTNSIPVSR
ncbi:hypothetical protein C2S52_001935 [Perilla frutescens var. hirtella]|nr:hypothetical protein C2S52_001935 [Perilla frutescens var. hirtella]